MPRNFSVILNDEPDKATIVLAISADLSSFLVADGEGHFRRVALSECRLGTAYFDVNELNWANLFTNPSPEGHAH